MQYVIVAAGRWKAGPERDLYEKFEKRIQPSLLLKEVDQKRKGSKVERLRREGIILLNAVPDGARIIAMDENGKNLSSMGLANQLQHWRNAGVQKTAFLIGGADGHDTNVLEGADLILSLGPQTWPHMMVRFMIAEQIYRAQSILTGHPYHRE